MSISSALWLTMGLWLAAVYGKNIFNVGKRFVNYISSRNNLQEHLKNVTLIAFMLTVIWSISLITNIIPFLVNGLNTCQELIVAIIQKINGG
jgi:hypothetical protein